LLAILSFAWASMKPDDELCLCFHVTKRKVTNFLRVEKPRRASQLSECFGAGTGCGWCRPFLQRMFEMSQSSVENPPANAENPSAIKDTLPDADQYAQDRQGYIREGKGTPPPGS
jgi:NAD(P)H-nitrite reductase large subunit